MHHRRECYRNRTCYELAIRKGRVPEPPPKGVTDLSIIPLCLRYEVQGRPLNKSFVPLLMHSPKIN